MPNVDKKPKGVITIYLSKLPVSFADLFYGHMSQDRWLENYEKENSTKLAGSEVVRDPNAMSNNKKKFGAFVTEFEPASLVLFSFS